MTLEQLQAMLAEAQSAYHTVMLGGGVVTVVDQNGERVCLLYTSDAADE